MLKGIHLLLITILVALSAQGEIKTSIPDFSEIDQATLAPMTGEIWWSTSLPSKNKHFDENLYSRAGIGPSVTELPKVQVFHKLDFIRLCLSYRASRPRTHHLLI